MFASVEWLMLAIVVSEVGDPVARRRSRSRVFLPPSPVPPDLF
jgi:hypothetical protein